MSYSTIYRIPHEGEIQEGRKFHNSWHGAFAIWDVLAKRHLGWKSAHDGFAFKDKSSDLWGISKREGIPMSDRVALACTFDNAILKLGNVPWYCDLMEEFIDRYDMDDYHPRDWVDYLESCYASGLDIFGFCWCQTSVVSDIWMVEDENIDDEDERRRMFDWSLDQERGDFFFLRDLLEGI